MCKQTHSFALYDSEALHFESNVLFYILILTVKFNRYNSFHFLNEIENRILR